MGTGAGIQNDASRWRLNDANSRNSSIRSSFANKRIRIYKDFGILSSTFRIYSVAVKAATKRAAGCYKS